MHSLSDAILTLGGCAGEVGLGEGWEGSRWMGADCRMVLRQEETLPPLWWEEGEAEEWVKGWAKSPIQGEQRSLPF